MATPAAEPWPPPGAPYSPVVGGLDIAPMSMVVGGSVPWAAASPPADEHADTTSPAPTSRVTPIRNERERADRGMVPPSGDGMSLRERRYEDAGLATSGGAPYRAPRRSLFAARDMGPVGRRGEDLLTGSRPAAHHKGT